MRSPQGHLDDDLALGPSSSELGQGPVGRLEGDHAVDDRADGLPLYEPGDLGQLGAVRAHVEEGVSDPACLGPAADAEAEKPHDQRQHDVQTRRLREVRVRRSGKRDQLPAWPEDVQRLAQRLPVQAGENDVVAVQDLLELLAPVVDDEVSAEALDEVGVAGARRGRHRRAEVLSELDRDGAHAARAGVDQHFVPRFTWASSTRACHAVRPTRGMDAASAMDRLPGLGARSASSTAMRSARVPIRPSRGRA